MSRKIIIAVSFVAVFVAAGCSVRQEKVYPYPFQTAKIEFSLTGNIEGTRTLYIKGDKAAHETHAVKKKEGEEEKLDSLYLDLGEFMYLVDFNLKSGVKAKNPMYDELKKLPADQRLPYLVRAAVGLLAPGSEEPKSAGTKEIAGKTCDIYAMRDVGETCLWNGIPIYTAVKIPDAGVDSVSTATSIGLDIDIPDKTFEIPADVKVQDA